MQYGKVYPQGAFKYSGFVKAHEFTVPALNTNCKLMIFGDSAGDATGKTITTGVGTLQINTTTPKFSQIGSSWYLDGSTYMYAADSADFAFGTGDLTIHGYFNFTTLPASGSLMGFYSQHVDVDNRVRFYVLNTSGTYSVNWILTTGGSEVLALAANITAPSTGVDYHYALQRTGNVWTVSIDGTAVATTTASITYPDIAATFDIGRAQSGAGTSFYFNGKISGFEVLKGTAAFTVPFTPPTYSYYGGARTVYNITGVSGNTDIEYKFNCKFVNNYNGNALYYLRPNNDTGNNYGYQQLYGSNTSAAAVQTTSTSVLYLTGGNTAVNEKAFCNGLLYAKSGYLRLWLNKDIGGTATTTVGIVDLMAGSWNNTADNITALRIVGSQINSLGVGTNIILFKKVYRS